MASLAPRRPPPPPAPQSFIQVVAQTLAHFADKVKYSCTKCSKKFSASAKLHAHILDCASASRKMADSAERAQTKYVFKKGLGRIGIQAKKMPSASRMKLKAAIGYQNKVITTTTRRTLLLLSDELWLYPLVIQRNSGRLVSNPALWKTLFR